MPDKKAFILLGDVRIRISNIKNYGISSEEKPYEKIYTKTGERKIAFLLRLLTALNGRDYIPILEWKGDSIAIDDDRYEELLKLAEHYEAPILYREEGNQEILTSRQYYSSQEDPVIFKKVKYLYITTFQRDNYTFYEDEVSFNIFKKCKELDELVNGSN